MAAYVVIQVNVTDPEKYAEYKKLTPASVAKFGGTFLARGGPQYDLEGTLPYSRVVLLQFPDTDQAKRWYDSPEYRRARTVRAGASEGTFTIVEGAPG